MAEQDVVFGDQNQAFQQQQAKIARRRALAEQLVQQGMSNDIGQGYQGGKVYIVGNPLSNIAQSVAGQYFGSQADKDESALNAQQQSAQDQWQQQYAAAPDDATRQNLLAQARNKGLKYNLEKQFAEQEAKQRELEQQKEAERIARREDLAIKLGSDAELKREGWAAQKELRATPTQHFTINQGGAGAGNEFAGAMTQIGVIPEGREGAGNPIYRVTKTGKNFTFDSNGNPVAFGGMAIAPKPQPMDAATRKAIHEGNLGIQGVDDALAKLSDPNAKGATGIVNALPGAETVRQYTDPEGIDARAAVSNIGSLKLHDRSGAAVTISEFPRLAPFIPKVTDSPVAATRKLNNLKAEYSRMVDEWSGKPVAKPGAAKPDKLTPQEQAELDQLRAKHGRK